MNKKQVSSTLREYIAQSIIPCYDAFDAAHRRDHVERVIEQSLSLATHYDVDLDMVYCTAAFHDVGLCEGREVHHLVSARMMRADRTLRRWFSEEQIALMAEAVEDHRASSAREPRSLYGRIVAEADRDIEPEKIVLRTIQYGLSHYGFLDEEGHWRRTLSHLKEKYGEGGYMKLWIAESPNAAQLQKLREMIADEKGLKTLFLRVYNEQKSSGS